MAWFLCTISHDSPRNWDICKEIGAWGVSTQREDYRLDRTKVGDHLLIWVARRGYIAYATASQPMRRPVDKKDAPWPGGLHRFGAIVPFSIDVELNPPLYIKFENQRQKITDVSLFQFRRGFVAINDAAGEAAAAAMRDAQVEQLQKRDSPAL